MKLKFLITIPISICTNLYGFLKCTRKVHLVQRVHQTFHDFDLYVIYYVHVTFALVATTFRPSC